MRKLSQTTKTVLNISTLVLLFCIDRLSKVWALHELETPRILINRVLELQLVHNQRIAFFLNVPTWVSSLLVVIVLVIVAAVLVQEYKYGHRVAAAALGLVIIGAFSNLLDRMRHGSVTDFINVPFWSVFNLADVYIVVGIVIVFFATRVDKAHRTSSL